MVTGRIPGDRPRGDGYLRIPPDLVVEVISPSNSASEIRNKVRDYLRLGVRMVWVVFDDPAEVQVYRGDTMRAVFAGDVLDGEDVVPGFSVPVDLLFGPVQKATTAG
ncbi:hypothetical protein AYO38_11235 [bacterium SCGC AG-212-C10]|nr:hypothetical protein AYO38_11235 [bacterium SCGC AG-212-C10]